MRTENTGTAELSHISPPASAPSGRLDWPDVAKGLSIFGVVLLHVTLAVPEAENTLAAELNHFLDPLRMPLFFVVSGLFSAKILNQTFEQLFKRRLWFFLVPYLLWAPLEMFSKRLISYFTHGNSIPDAMFYWEKVSEGTNSYWFFYFLVVFNLLAWATRKFPGWALCLVPFLPWLFMPMYNDESIVRNTVLYFPAFFIGIYFRPLIMRFAKAAQQPKAIVAGVGIYVAAMGLSVLEETIRYREPGAKQMWLINLKNDTAALLGGSLDDGDLVQFSGMVIRCLSIPAGIVLAVWLSKVRYLGTLLNFLGRHTLVIYIGHAFGLGVAFKLIAWKYMEIDNSSAYFWHWSSSWMIIAIASAFFGGWVFHLMSKTPVLGWTLTPPRLPEFVTNETSVRS